MAGEVKSYVKDTIDFLRKFCSLPNLPNDVILCNIYVAGLYPNITHDEGLPARRKRLDLREEKYVTKSTLLELVEVVLKSNIFAFHKTTLKQKWGSVTRTKFAPPYSILFIVELEEKYLSEIELGPCVGGT